MPPTNRKLLTPEETRRVIDALGGTKKVADLCGVKPPSVSEWKRKGMPNGWVHFLRLLRPDVWSEQNKNDLSGG